MKVRVDSESYLSTAAVTDIADKYLDNIHKFDILCSNFLACTGRLGRLGRNVKKQILIKWE